MATRIWTIGHSVHPLERMIGMLQHHDMRMLVDVRTYPASRRVPWFNKEPFAEALTAQAIGYLHMPALGGRRKARKNSPHTALRNDGFRGYADHMDTPEFSIALGKLKEIAEAHRTCIMCAEVLWWSCHRSFIADRLKVEGWTVPHIMPNEVQEHPYTKAARVEEGRLTYGDALMP